MWKRKHKSCKGEAEEEAKWQHPVCQRENKVNEVVPLTNRNPDAIIFGRRQRLPFVLSSLQHLKIKSEQSDLLLLALALLLQKNMLYPGLLDFL